MLVVVALVVLALAYLVIAGRSSAEPARSAGVQSSLSGSSSPALTGVLAGSGAPATTKVLSADDVAAEQRAAQSSAMAAAAASSSQAAADASRSSAAAQSAAQKSAADKSSAAASSSAAAKKAADDKAAAEKAAKDKAAKDKAAAEKAAKDKAAAEKAAQEKAAKEAAEKARQPTKDAQGNLICGDGAMDLQATTGTPTFAAGSQPILGVKVTYTGDVACQRDLSGALQVFTVLGINGDRVWSTADCFPGSGTDIRQLNPGDSVQYNIKWSGTTSAPGCTGDRIRVPAGDYVLHVEIGSLKAKTVAFKVV